MKADCRVFVRHLLLPSTVTLRDEWRCRAHPGTLGIISRPMVGALNERRVSKGQKYFSFCLLLILKVFCVVQVPSERSTRRPPQGKFWHADHIVPVVRSHASFFAQAGTGGNIEKHGTLRLWYGTSRLPDTLQQAKYDLCCHTCYGCGREDHHVYRQQRGMHAWGSARGFAAEGVNYDFHLAAPPRLPSLLKRACCRRVADDLSTVPVV